MIPSSGPETPQLSLSPSPAWAQLLTGLVAARCSSCFASSHCPELSMCATTPWTWRRLTISPKMFLKTPSIIMASEKKIKLPPLGLYRLTSVHSFVFAYLGLCVCLHSCSPAVYTCLSLKGCAPDACSHIGVHSLFCLCADKEVRTDRHPLHVADWTSDMP